MPVVTLGPALDNQLTNAGIGKRLGKGQQASLPGPVLLPIRYRSGHRDDGLEVKSSDLLDDGLSAFGAFIMVVKPLLAWEAKVPGDLAQFLPLARRQHNSPHGIHPTRV
jgi:hypothetical protein